ncbi:MAG: PLP-dependent aminotransferase family protein [Actinomycetota bacterium]|nr:PLP-dependent aminotransferase family protein [Actinomycetota bacterium]
MSYNPDWQDLRRGAQTSLTEQIVERFRVAIDAGVLAPGEKLPTTRALAEQAGVNHLTAVRAYRRLAEEGYVSATVGRGTFVRTVPPAAAAASTGTAWQNAVLPEDRPSYPNEMLAQSFRLPEDPELISLATGWPDPRLYPVQALQRTAARVFDELGGEALSYVNPEGAGSLREQLALRGREHGFAASADEIVVTSGAYQALDLVCRAIVSPGDVVAVESPTFMGMLSSLQATGARVIGIPTDGDGFDVAALERVLARHEVKLVALQTACANPTGQDMSPERRERLVELARERSFFVLEDGVYATVRFEGEERPRLRGAAPSHVVYVDSLSKTIGGGLRLGWVAASGPVRRRIATLKMSSDMHTSSLVQHVAAAYLAEGAHELYVAGTLPVYRERRDALLDSLARRLEDEVTFVRPLGGHHVWVRFATPLDERALFAEAVRQGVGFLPGGAMTAERPDETALRLSFPLWEPDQLDEAVRRLAAAVRAVRRLERGPLVAVS